MPPNRAWAASLLGAVRGRHAYDAALAVVVMLIIGMMIIPLPTWMLDILIVSNISLGVLMLLIAMYIGDGLGFAAMPTVLLVTTLYRLALNVSSTRLILLQADAGRVIESFGEFVVQGNYIVGAIIFLILTLIQYLVVAKGSERVAEVGARFTLDAMPGKQMAIDADLRTGLSSQEQVQHKRRVLERESQFYGAMDGAMKFVKGDAIAGMIITLINIIGGVAIGVGTRELELAQSLRTYGLLTIGDGLVSQIPSLLISTSAGVVVTRVASEDRRGSLGSDIGSQLFGDARVIAVGAIFLTVLALVPGLPALPFLVLAVTLGVVARVSLNNRRKRGHEAAEHEVEAITEPASVAPITVRLGRELYGRLPRPARETIEQNARQGLSTRRGLWMPRVSWRSSDSLGDDEAAIDVYELEACRTRAPRTLEGDELTSAVASALDDALARRRTAFVGMQEVQGLLDRLERTHPALVRNVVPDPVSLPLLTAVLRRLVEEDVSIRPLRDILEALSDLAVHERDPARLTEQLRARLRLHITHQYAPAGALAPYLLDPMIEDALHDAIHTGARGDYLALPPRQASDIIGAVRAKASGAAGGSPVLLTSGEVRRFLRELIASELPQVVVLSFDELTPDTRIEGSGRVTIGASAEDGDR